MLYMENNLKTRKNLRLVGYNYSNNGSYFITICVKNRECILSKIINDNGNIELLEYGKITKKYIQTVDKVYKDIKITKYVIMPNHIHLICDIYNDTIKDETRQNERIPFLISTLKRLTNKESKIKIWQGSY